MRPRSDCAAFGVKPRLTSSLKRSCWGGSITSIIWRWTGEVLLARSRPSITPRAAELNSFGWRLIARMSAYLVIAQNPGPVGLRVPVHRIVGPQPGVLLPRVAARRRRRWR